MLADEPPPVPPPAGQPPKLRQTGLGRWFGAASPTAKAAPPSPAKPEEPRWGSMVAAMRPDKKESKETSIVMADKTPDKKQSKETGIVMRDPRPAALRGGRPKKTYEDNTKGKYTTVTDKGCGSLKQ